MILLLFPRRKRIDKALAYGYNSIKMFEFELGKSGVYEILRTWRFFSVDVLADSSLSYDEVFCHVNEELSRLGESGKSILRMECRLSADKQNVEIRSFQALPTRFVERLTGECLA